MSKKRDETPKALSALNDQEAASVLRGLVKARPELAGDIERLSQRVMEDVSRDGVADDVEEALISLDDIDNLNDRAGSTRHGYVEPSEAAYEMCEEALLPFREDMERRLKAGHIPGASAVCEGLVWGCYRVRKRSGGVIEYCDEDGLCTIAGDAVDFFLKGSKTKGCSAFLSEEYLGKCVPEWAECFRLS